MNPFANFSISSLTNILSIHIKIGREVYISKSSASIILSLLNVFSEIYLKAKYETVKINQIIDDNNLTYNNGPYRGDRVDALDLKEKLDDLFHQEAYSNNIEWWHDTITYNFTHEHDLNFPCVGGSLVFKFKRGILKGKDFFQDCFSYPAEGIDIKKEISILIDIFEYYCENINQNESISSFDLVYFVHSLLNQHHSHLNIDKMFQKIILGPPGSGKSHYLSQRLIRLDLKNQITNQEKRDQVTRITCHAEMTSADFIGSYQPVSDTDGKIYYRFEPGPFTRLLHRALRNLDEYHVLIIEELNRANAAAMFAEAFQLLDRIENNDNEDLYWSTYPTSLGAQVLDYLTKRNQDNTTSDALTDDVLNRLNGAVRLPPNFMIWATLNTADQSVFPLDTAFKRRWSFEYLGVDDGKEIWSNDPWNPLIPGYPNLRWQDLRQAINTRLEENEIEEDRQLGAFFLTSTELDVSNDPIAFLKRLLDKVVSYLRHDVVRADPAILFKEFNTGERDYVPSYALLRRRALENGLLSIFREIKNKHMFTKELLNMSSYQSQFESITNHNNINKTDDEQTATPDGQ